LLAADVDPAPDVEPELFPELDDESEAGLPEPDLLEPDSPEPSEEDAAPLPGFSELLPESPDFGADLDPLAA
jgi:hypothetical protein